MALKLDVLYFSIKLNVYRNLFLNTLFLAAYIIISIIKIFHSYNSPEQQEYTATDPTTLNGHCNVHDGLEDPNIESKALTRHFKKFYFL